MSDQQQAELARTLAAFLRARGSLDQTDTVDAVRQVDGGWSRNTYVADATVAGTARKFVVRAEIGGGLTGAALDWEYGVYRDLQGSVTVPAVLGLESSPDNGFGGPYFVMDFVPGSAPNLWKREAHVPLAADWNDGRGIAKDFVKHLADIHLIDPQHAPSGLERLSYRDLIDRWATVYRDCRLARDPVVEEALAWLEESTPPTGRLGVVHGDYRMGNLLVHDGSIAAVLDWELAHVGDVNYDLGYVSLQYIAGRHLKPKTELLAGVADREWLFAEYERLTGDTVDREAIRSWSVLSLVALIVMAMTGFRAFDEGKTSDVRRIWSRWALPGLRRELTEIAGW